MITRSQFLRWLGICIALSCISSVRLFACDDNNNNQNDQVDDPPPDPGDDGTWGSDGDGNYTWIPDTGTAPQAYTAPSPPPPPSPPSIYWTSLPGGDFNPGDGFFVQAQGSDSSGLLSAVSIDMSQDAGGSWSPFAYAGGGDGYNGDSNNGGNAQSGAAYEFRAWASDSTGQNSGTIYSSVYNVATPPPIYPVSISALGPGNVSTGGGNYQAGSSFSLSAIPNSFSRFNGWSGDLSGSDNPTTITVNGPLSVVATFSASQANLTLTTSGNGTASGGGTYDAGSQVLIQASAGTNSVFTGWSPSGGIQNPSASSTSVSLNQDTTLTANFAVATALLTTSVSGNGQVSGGGTYPIAASATVTATASPGNLFTGWSGSLTGNANPASVQMDTDKTAIGLFSAQLAQTISVTVPPSQLTSAPAITLQATATSGLPVSFQLTGGPATLTAGKITLTGSPGVVTLLASQGGNMTYTAAPSVPFSFAVTAPTKLTTTASDDPSTKKNDPKTPSPNYILSPSHP